MVNYFINYKNESILVFQLKNNYDIYKLDELMENSKYNDIFKKTDDFSYFMLDILTFYDMRFDYKQLCKMSFSNNCLIYFDNIILDETKDEIINFLEEKIY